MHCCMERELSEAGRLCIWGREGLRSSTSSTKVGRRGDLAGGLVGDGACALHPDVTIQINQESVKFLAEHFDGRIVFLSTCSVYGAQDGELDEESPLNPLSVYASTKLAAEGFGD